MPLHLLVKWEVVSPNSRWGQLESISIISSIPLFCFCISNVGWFGGGGGVMFFSHFMLFPTFLENKPGNSFLYPLFLCSDFVSQMWGGLGGGGGVMFFSHFMLFPTFLEQNLGIQI